MNFVGDTIQPITEEKAERETYTAESITKDLDEKSSLSYLAFVHFYQWCAGKCWPISYLTCGT